MRERSAEKSLTNAIIRSNPLIGVERGLRTATTLEGSMEKRALKKAPRKCAVFSLPANPRRPNRGSCARHTDRSEGAPEGAAGPVFLHVGTTFVEPTVAGYEPTEGATTDPYPAVPSACASANVLVSVKAVASAIVVTFMRCVLVIVR